MTLLDAGRQALDLLGRLLENTRPGLEIAEIGEIARLGGSIATIKGLTDVEAEELLALEGGVLGVAVDLEPGEVGAILLDHEHTLSVGSQVRRTGRVVDVPVGGQLLGRVVDPLGRPLDDAGEIRAAEHWPAERPAPPIIRRAPVTRPMQTGIKAIDATVPIGRGQRELILGDRQTGKTTIAVDAMINQKGGGVVAIYCAVGQRLSAVARVVADLRRNAVLDQCIVVVASGEDAPGLQYIAPFAATSMAEWFMEQGRDVLVVYDDLTRHARAYRELSLLLRRPPGREAFPGDIFYLHARLLERATQLRPEQGGGSMTALPIIETEAQNIAAYIPTNLISITDGQIYLSPDLFAKGQLPAIDIGKSVSRVGGKAQLPALRVVAGDLKLRYAQFEELEIFARFGTRLDEETRRKLVRGERVRAALQQGEHAPMPVAEQAAVLLAATQGTFDDVAPGEVAEAEQRVRRVVRERHPTLCEAMEAGEALSAQDREMLLATVRDAVGEVAAHAGPEA